MFLLGSVFGSGQDIPFAGETRLARLSPRGSRRTPASGTPGPSHHGPRAVRASRRILSRAAALRVTVHLLSQKTSTIRGL